MRIIVIPDTQTKPGAPLAHLKWIGKYIQAKQPDFVVHLGDHYDLPSLSTYDRGTKRAEGRRLHHDLAAGELALDILNIASDHYQPPRGKVITLGNHEERLFRHINANPELDGVLGLESFRFEEYGWVPWDFLRPYWFEGIQFCHYFVRNAEGLVVQSRRGMPSAKAQVVREGCTSISGHQQGLKIHVQPYQDRHQWGVIAGSCLTPNHKVLTADLRYIPLGDVEVGQKLVSFDESLEESQGRSRRYKTGTVLAVKTEPDVVYRVELSDGHVFHATADHLWLSRGASTKAKWKRTDQLRVQKNGGSRIYRPLELWNHETSHEAGYLAGMYDGEGCYYTKETSAGRTSQLTLSQLPGVVLDRTTAALERFVGESYTHKYNRRVSTLYLKGGAPKQAELLGKIRPSRLLAKFRPEHLGRITCNSEQKPYVVSVEPAGVKDVVRIDIDARTMIVDGYCHHNCYLHDEHYLTHQGTKYWKGIIVLNSVDRGDFSPWFVDLDWLCKEYEGVSLDEFVRDATDLELLRAVV